MKTTNPRKRTFERTQTAESLKLRTGRAHTLNKQFYTANKTRLSLAETPEISISGGVVCPLSKPYCNCKPVASLCCLPKVVVESCTQTPTGPPTRSPLNGVGGWWTGVHLSARSTTISTALGGSGGERQSPPQYRAEATPCGSTRPAEPHPEGRPRVRGKPQRRLIDCYSQTKTAVGWLL